MGKSIALPVGPLLGLETFSAPFPYLPVEPGRLYPLSRARIQAKMLLGVSRIQLGKLDGDGKWLSELTLGVSPPLSVCNPFLSCPCSESLHKCGSNDLPCARQHTNHLKISIQKRCTLAGERGEMTFIMQPEARVATDSFPSVSISTVLPEGEGTYDSRWTASASLLIPFFWTSTFHALAKIRP